MLHARKMAEVKDRRREAATAFEDFDEKTNQLFNVLSTVLKNEREMSLGVARNLR